MAKLLYSGSHGPEDPTRASFPFHMAKGAKEAGHEPAIVLSADAPFLLNDSVRDSVFGVGMPPLKDLFQFAVDNRIPIFV